jgi:hypothetical protein
LRHAGALSHLPREAAHEDQRKRKDRRGDFKLWQGLRGIHGSYSLPIQRTDIVTVLLTRPATLTITSTEAPETARAVLPLLHGCNTTQSPQN